jgi:hypothetical protein
VAKNKLKKRIRKALRKELRRREEARRHPLGPGRSSGPNEPWVPEREFTWPDEEHGEDPDGGAGVREPRHPRPTMPAAAITLAEPELQYLDLTR